MRTNQNVKNALIAVWVPRSLRAKMRLIDVNWSAVIRKFVAAYVKKHGNGGE